VARRDAVSGLGADISSPAALNRSHALWNQHMASQTRSEGLLYVKARLQVRRLWSPDEFLRDKAAEDVSLKQRPCRARALAAVQPSDAAYFFICSTRWSPWNAAASSEVSLKHRTFSTRSISEIFSDRCESRFF
jgi:hypothetical protein